MEARLHLAAAPESPAVAHSFVTACLQRWGYGDWRGPDRLFVKGRDRSSLLDGLGRQVVAVHAAAGDLIAETVTSLSAVLCFVDVEVGLLAKPLTVDGIHVTWPRPLMARLREPGPLIPEQVAALAEGISSTFPPA